MRLSWLRCSQWPQKVMCVLTPGCCARNLWGANLPWDKRSNSRSGTAVAPPTSSSSLCPWEHAGVKYYLSIAVACCIKRSHNPRCFLLLQDQFKRSETAPVELAVYPAMGPEMNSGQGKETVLIRFTTSNPKETTATWQSRRTVKAWTWNSHTYDSGQPKGRSGRSKYTVWTGSSGCRELITERRLFPGLIRLKFYSVLFGLYILFAKSPPPSLFRLCAR